ncbi:hypothetical protein K491DRAFT_651838 [Lophiostoma macrostomum CBS 122681]|uniref:DUF6594 domain-containing protein n=1 Tax=Lophiostoma macrostomum CBS 122681 TaxID=1314788 RepID=A0A6A6TJ78_9PLEO|nr:hypothetical protein K491DRAFT_651838 [Lophiostoma macrostomum CBS 122681]
MSSPDRISAHVPLQSQPILKAKPWKTIGYRGYSTFLASDNDFLVFRRFGTLNTRVLLLLQDEISVLEQKLEDLDITHSQPAATDIHNGSFRQEVLPERRALLLEVHKKIREYNELLIQNSTLQSAPRVPQRNIASLDNWLHNKKNAILDEEAAYIQHRHDLVPLVPKAISGLRQLLEQSSHFRFSSLWRKKPPPSADHDEAIHYSSDRRIDAFIGVAVTIMGMLMLIVPLWVLAVTEGMLKRLGVITGFVVLFLCLVAFATVAKPFEALAAAAAYSAVLVVFLQISE